MGTEEKNQLNISMKKSLNLVGVTKRKIDKKKSS